MRLDSGCHRYLQEALNYHSQLYAQPVLQTLSTTLRSGSTVLLVAGGRTTDNCVCREMWAADQSCAAWHKVGDLCVPVYNHCVASINDFLFVIGGQCTFDPTGKQPSNEVRYKKPLALEKQLGEGRSHSSAHHRSPTSTRLSAPCGTESPWEYSFSGKHLRACPCSYCKLPSSSVHTFPSAGSARSTSVNQAPHEHHPCPRCCRHGTRTGEARLKPAASLQNCAFLGFACERQICFSSQDLPLLPGD